MRWNVAADCLRQGLGSRWEKSLFSSLVFSSAAFFLLPNWPTEADATIRFGSAAHFQERWADYRDCCVFFCCCCVCLGVICGMFVAAIHLLSGGWKEWRGAVARCWCWKNRRGRDPSVTDSVKRMGAQHLEKSSPRSRCCRLQRQVAGGFRRIVLHWRKFYLTEMLPGRRPSVTFQPLIPEC